MAPTRYQSGETDYSGRISKLTRPLKGWATRIAKRAGMKEAAVALASGNTGTGAKGALARRYDSP
jgi:hypothetical protein